MKAAESRKDTIKCMGYKEKERKQAAGEHAVDVQDG